VQEMTDGKQTEKYFINLIIFVMEELENKIIEIELRQKKLKNRTDWLVPLVPIMTIVVSIMTTYLTIQQQFNLSKLNFSQEEIKYLLKDEDVISARKKIKFLIESGLLNVGAENNKIIKALDDNLVDDYGNSLTYLLAGHRYLSIAEDSENTDTSSKYFALSIQYFLKSLDRNLKNPDAHAWLGYAYHKTGELLYLPQFLKTALIEYDEALTLDPTLSWVHVKKAKLYYRSHEFKDAAMELKTAYKLGIDDPTIMKEAENMKYLLDP
jgi:tetratricopeptide (TPR) repeat protein